MATAVRLVRPEGELTAARLTIEEAAKTLLIDDLRSTVFPAPVVRQTSPHIFRFVDAYQFSQPPAIRMAGRVGLKNVELNDFTLDVVATGDVQATLPDRTVLPLISPRSRFALGRLPTASSVARSSASRAVRPAMRSWSTLAKSPRPPASAGASDACA